jgi:hypothetical protein
MTGMQMAEGTFYHNVADLFSPLRMPLFGAFAPSTSR